MIQVTIENEGRIRQGDIISDVEYIESVREESGVITLSRIIYPLVIVLTQDCDLSEDYKSRIDESRNQDKYLLSVIVAPLYNYEHFILGEHLTKLGQHMTTINRNPEKTENKNLRQNQTPRYHYFEFDDKLPIAKSVADFKHYFTVNVKYLQIHKKDHFICSVSELFRERVLQRFTNYLSRIGLPEISKDDKSKASM